MKLHAVIAEADLLLAALRAGIVGVYGRTLAYLFDSEDRHVNFEMARRGYAVSLTYPPNVRYVDAVRAAVREARAERRGLWATSAFECEPRQHRRGACE